VNFVLYVVLFDLKMYMHYICEHIKVANIWVIGICIPFIFLSIDFYFPWISHNEHELQSHNFSQENEFAERKIETLILDWIHDSLLYFLWQWKSQAYEKYVPKKLIS
jgi:hypothetical protein